MAFNNTAQQYTVTATATHLPASPVLNQVTLTAKSTNSGVVYLGFSASVTSSNGYALEKGTSVTLKVADNSSIYVVGTASDILSTIGS